MPSPGNSSSELHQPSLNRIEAAFGPKFVQFYQELAKGPIRSAHLDWLTEDDNTNGMLVPVLTLSLVEDIDAEI